MKKTASRQTFLKDNYATPPVVIPDNKAISRTAKKRKKNRKKTWVFVILGTKNEGQTDNSPSNTCVFIPETPQNRQFRHFSDTASRFIHHMGIYT